VDRGGVVVSDNITLRRAAEQARKALELALESQFAPDDAECEHGMHYRDCPNDACVMRDCKAALAALDAALAEPEPALQVDALRYRWIAENALAIDFVADPDNMVQIWHGTDPARFSAGKTLDEAVDAARRRT
jgi:hypothetical protein